MRYRVKGWSIRQAKSTDTAGGLWKEGDILYEVEFERSDPHPMDSFSNRPTATEVDDYTEYKRLRKLYREGKRDHLPGAIAEVTSIGARLPALVKAAPPIPPPSALLPSPVPIKAAKILDLNAPTTVRKSVRYPHFDVPLDTPLNENENENNVDPLTVVPEASYFPPQPPPRRGSTLTVPTFISRHFKAPASTLPTPQGSPSRTPGTVSPASSNHTGVSIRDVAPWIDLEAATPVDPLPPPLSTSATDSSPHKDSSALQSSLLSLMKKKQGTLNVGARERRQSASPARRERRRSGGDGHLKKSLANVVGLGILKGKDAATTTTATATGRRSIVARSRNPIAKLLDGAEDQHSEDTQELLPEDALDCASEESQIERVASPVPMRLFSVDSPFVHGRRRGIYSISEKSGEDEDPFVEKSAAETCVHTRTADCGGSAERVDEVVGSIAFQDLVWDSEKRKQRRERMSIESGVAPDE